MLTVLQHELIRRKVLVDGLSQREVAQELGHSRKTVEKAVSHLEPPGYRRQVARKRPVLEPVASIIESWLEADRTRPRKQRHAAQRVRARGLDCGGLPPRSPVGLVGDLADGVRGHARRDSFTSSERCHLSRFERTLCRVQ